MPAAMTPESVSLLSSSKPARHQSLKVWTQMTVLASLTLLASAATYFFHPHAPALHLQGEPVNDGEISPTGARAAMKSPGVIFIDARVRARFDAGHIPDALPLCESESNYPAQLSVVADTLQQGQEKLVVVYCDGKKCQASHEIAEILKSFHTMPENVRVLHGGWPAWQAAP